MTQNLDRPILARPVKVDEIRDGTSGNIETTEAERKAVANMLDLEALTALTLAYRFDHIGGGRIRLTGTLHANLTQACVLSLESLERSLEVPVEVEFWPEALIAQSEASATESGGSGLLDWPEAIVDGRIDLGPVVYDSLATSLDPYPKSEGASFDWSSGGGEEGEGSGGGPFSALAALKRR
jgi:uncharacterized protein DUF177 involved in 23S rRNA accumulation